MKLKKALYGYMQSALSWYKTLKGYLESEGFSLNPYDQCIANKTIKGHQCSIAWFVDDSKVSHVELDVVSDVIRGLENRFGKMAGKRGKLYNFVGMDIKYNDDKTISKACAVSAR